MVALPLFPVEGQGSIPMSPLQFDVIEIPRLRFIKLNKKWHSVLPLANDCWHGDCYACEFKNVIFAVAWWSHPIAGNRLKLGKNILELRRMAICDLAPKNTATRFLKIMCIILKKKYQHIYKFISYQDTENHLGTIYKASGWNPTESQKKFETWKGHSKRAGLIDQSTAIKVRWEKQIRPEPITENNNFVQKKR